MENNQVKKDLSEHMKEIIDVHLFVDKNEIVFKKNIGGLSLRELLINEGLDAIFFDSKNNVVRSYGVFAINNDGDVRKKIIPLIKKVSVSRKIEQTKLVWNSLSLNASTIPLIYKGNISGYMILAKSTADYVNMQQIMLIVFSILGILTLLCSFFVGHKIASEFNNMIDRLRDMNKRQKEFIANASHELKTPLTRAITSLELIELENKNPDDIEQIKNDLFHINTTIEQLLLLAKMKKDIHISTRPEKVLLIPLFEQLKKLFAENLDKKHIKLIGTFPHYINITLPIEFLEIIFSNLISNAIKFSPSHKTVELVIKEIDKKLIIKVIDQGHGINKDEVKNIFKRFYRVNESGLEDGHGIGLSLVKQICDLYGIMIEVNSVINKGTTITLLF